MRNREEDFKPGDLGHSMEGPNVDVGRHTRRTLASFSMTDKVSSFSPRNENLPKWGWNVPSGYFICRNGRCDSPARLLTFFFFALSHRRFASSPELLAG